MTILDVLRHQWTRWRRPMSRTRSFLTTSLFGLAAAYIGGWFVALGGFYPDIAAEVAPTRDPLRLLNEHLLSGMAGLVAVRFFLQRFDAGEDHLLLCLPLRRTTLVRALQVALAVSLLNLVTLLSLGALVARTVVAVLSPLGAVFWTTGVLMAVAMTHFAYVWLRVAWIRRRWAAFLVASVVVLGLVGGDFLGGTGIREASVWLFGGPSRGRIGPFLVLAAGTVALAVASTTALRRYTYEWGDGARSERHRRFSLDIRGARGARVARFPGGKPDRAESGAPRTVAPWRRGDPVLCVSGDEGCLTCVYARNGPIYARRAIAGHVRPVCVRLARQAL